MRVICQQNASRNSDHNINSLANYICHARMTLSGIHDSSGFQSGFPIKIVSGMTICENINIKRALISLIWILLLFFNVSFVWADDSPNILHRIEIRSHATATRLIFKLEKPAKQVLTALPGNRIRLRFPDTLTLQSKKLRKYNDAHIASVAVYARNSTVTVIVAMKGEHSAYRLLTPVQDNLVSLDIGPGVAVAGQNSVPLGRETIWSGTEKLMREFQPPMRSDVPFIPTDGKLLKQILPPEDVILFQKGEACLYKDNALEAETIFSSFMNRDISIRMIAAYRLGEATYMLGKYTQALLAFREGQRLSADYISQMPSAIFSYADTIIRNGDYEAGRQLLGRLIVGLAGTSYAAPALARLADINAREGREMQAVALYKNVVTNHSGNRAVYHAQIRLLDREFFKAGSNSYEPLLKQYKKIYSLGGDAALQEEAFFKAALLQALYGPLAIAVVDTAEYEKRYPSGVFSTVARTMHEELLLLLFRELKERADCKGLLKIVGENRNYLARCLSEEGFARHISQCFQSSGMLKDEMTLFISLVDSEWAVSSAPFLYRRIIADAIALRDYALAEAACRAFLERYPKHEMAMEVREQLGFLCYRKGDMQQVAALLSWLTGKAGRPERPESLYYLGKAQQSLKKYPAAEKATTMFLNELQSNKARSPFQVDACLINATARLARGDRAGAMAMYRAGHAIARGELRDTFMYKMAELYGLQGNSAEAKSMLEKLVREGNDPFWKNLAMQKLADMQWRETWDSPSKN
jgi:TolA-binding protein